MAAAFFVTLGACVVMALGILFASVTQEMVKSKQKDTEREAYLAHIQRFVDKVMSGDYPTYSQNTYIPPVTTTPTLPPEFLNPPDGIR